MSAQTNLWKNGRLELLKNLSYKDKNCQLHFLSAVVDNAI